MRKFQFKFDQGDGSPGNKDGYRYTVTLLGAVVAAGWTAGNKRDARQEAKRALEEQGLITDGIDS